MLLYCTQDSNKTPHFQKEKIHITLDKWKHVPAYMHDQNSACQRDAAPNCPSKETVLKEGWDSSCSWERPFADGSNEWE